MRKEVRTGIRQLAAWGCNLNDHSGSDMGAGVVWHEIHIIMVIGAVAVISFVITTVAIVIIIAITRNNIVMVFTYC